MLQIEEHSQPVDFACETHLTVRLLDVTYRDEPDRMPFVSRDSREIEVLPLTAIRAVDE